jgi:hypothetical protein
MSSDGFESWVERARAVPIGHELERRGVRLKRVGAEFVGPCPKCGGDDRFSINAKKGVFNCRGCNLGGDVIALVVHLDGVDFNTACTLLAGPPPKANGKGSGDAAEKARKVVVATFEYHDEAGDVVFVVERVEFQNADGGFVIKDNKHRKVFRQKRPDPDRPGEWRYNVAGVVRTVPYRLPQVRDAIAAGRPVLIVEGEGKADLLWSWGIAATCCAGGAKKWKREHSEFLRGADVVLLADWDSVGWEHVNTVGASLAGVANSTHVLILPGLLPKGDIVDWAAAGGTVEQLVELIREAPAWAAPLAAPLGDTGTAQLLGTTLEGALIAGLAEARGLDYARRKRAAADALGVGPADIDREVNSRRETAPLHGHWIVEP